jgi:uncharacterized glyoxalase superfamily protein PhnB
MRKYQTSGAMMNPTELSTCFCTNDVKVCKEFYQKYLQAEITFDCGWYLNLRIGPSGPTVQFMEPQGEMPVYTGTGVVLNFMVADVDAEYQRLMDAGLSVVMPLEDHPWGDRGFSVLDPLGTSVYIYSEREPSEEYRQFYKD